MTHIYTSTTSMTRSIWQNSIEPRNRTFLCELPNSTRSIMYHTSLNTHRGPAHLSDVLTHVLDHHLIRGDGLHGEQTPVVDVRLAEPDPLLPELKEGRGRRVSVDFEWRRTSQRRRSAARRLPSAGWTSAGRCRTRTRTTAASAPTAAPTRLWWRRGPALEYSSPAEGKTAFRRVGRRAPRPPRFSRVSPACRTAARPTAAWCSAGTWSCPSCRSCSTPRFARSPSRGPSCRRLVSFSSLSGC